MKREIYICIAAMFLCLSFSGCTSLMRMTGQLLDGTITASKTIEEYESAEADGVVVKHEQKKDGGEFLAIYPVSVPNLIFHASMPDKNGMMYITSYTFLCGGISGWNEFTMDISAGGTFLHTENTASLQVNSPVEIIGISSGKIRYNNNRVIEDSAVRTLNNRYERITALVDWMKHQQTVPEFENEKSFQTYWQPIVLPETVSQKKRPAAWNAEQGEWNTAEDIKWNVSYTQQIFPEDLYIYRNSGGLLRDFEEAISWIYLEYTWNNVCDQLNAVIQLTKK